MSEFKFEHGQVFNDDLELYENITGYYVSDNGCYKNNTISYANNLPQKQIDKLEYVIDSNIDFTNFGKIIDFYNNLNKIMTITVEDFYDFIKSFLVNCGFGTDYDHVEGGLNYYDGTYEEVYKDKYYFKIELNIDRPEMKHSDERSNFLKEEAMKSLEEFKNYYELNKLVPESTKNKTKVIKL